MKKIHWIGNRRFIIAQFLMILALGTYNWRTTHTIMYKEYVNNIKENLLNKQDDNELLEVFHGQFQFTKDFSQFSDFL